jgi:hypothetical protein
MQCEEVSQKEKIVLVLILVYLNVNYRMLGERKEREIPSPEMTGLYKYNKVIFLEKLYSSLTKL